MREINKTKQVAMFTDTETEEPKALIPRDYQQRIVEKVLVLFALGLNILLYLPTGGGKTECAVEICIRYLYKKTGKKILFVANRSDLVRQTQARFARYGIKAGIIQRGFKHTPDADVYILSIDSFKNRIDFVLELNFGLVIIDEAHNFVSRIVNKLKDLGVEYTPTVLSRVDYDAIFTELNVKDSSMK
jgi:superfamily II DNA or RNA helicase